MTTGIDLSGFDLDTWTVQRVAEERRLYAAACAGDDSAGAELQFWRAKFGALESSEIEALVRVGEREEQLRLLSATTLPNNRKDREWHPLAAFGVAQRSTRPKSPAKLLELRHAHGHLLSMGDLRAALTTEYAKRTKEKTKPKLSREDWAATVAELEIALVEYVMHLFKGTRDADALAYVHDSFPCIPWAKPDEAVDYPADW